MCTYLHQVNATYYFRRPVPDKLRGIIGRREFLFSLRTKDRDEAKRRIPHHTIATNRQLEAARVQLVADAAPEPVAPKVDRAVARARWDHDQSQDAMRNADADRRDWEAEELASLEEAQPDLARRIRADEREQIGLAQVEKRRASKKQIQAVEYEPAAKGKGVYLDTDIIDRWAAERGVVPKGKDTHRSVAEWFIARAGRKSVELYTRQDVLAFKDRLLAEGQTVSNTNMKLSRLRTLLGWAYQNDLAPANVADGISVKQADSGKNKRLPFSLTDLQTLFSGAVYTRGDRPNAGYGEAAYWLPLLALYTGARLEELAQLRVSDVRLERYPDQDGLMGSGWFLHITEATDEDGQENRLKNAISERMVPVHPEIQRLGFIAYVQGLTDQRGRVFPLLKPNGYGRRSALWASRWFQNYLRKTCGITEKRKVFHSFRHTFKDYARRSGLAGDVQRQLMGHAGKDVADGYGSGYDLHSLAVAMATYRIPGLTIPAPTQQG